MDLPVAGSLQLYLGTQIGTPPLKASVLDTLELPPPNPLSVTISYLILLIMPSLPFDKLNEMNYNDWKIQMEALLEEKGLFGVVSGQDVIPSTGPNSKVF